MGMNDNEALKIFDLLIDTILAKSPNNQDDDRWDTIIQAVGITPPHLRLPWHGETDLAAHDLARVIISTLL